MVIGVHGNLPTGTQFLALKVIRPEHATVIIQALPMGVNLVVVATRNQSIATNVVITMEDVNTTAWITMVAILASVTLATKSGQATSNYVTVSFTYFVFNLENFSNNSTTTLFQLQLLHYNNDERGQKEARGETELLGPKEILLLFHSGSRGKGKGEKADL